MFLISLEVRQVQDDLFSFNWAEAASQPDCQGTTMADHLTGD
jgi:hypothetical protein